jgi:1-acyl-sn-glycerol-3-phosphate acyltransferase
MFNMIKTVLAFIFLALFVLFLFPFGVAAMFFYLLGFKKTVKQFVALIEKVWGMTLIKVTGCKVEVTGRENIPPKGGVCFVSNHDGYFDIALLLAYCGRHVGFIAKKELLLVPFLNIWIYMIGGLFIDRGNIKKAVRTINKGAERIKSGGGMIIFPEGHRSKGQGLLPFHPGSLKLATMAEAPIVPVAIEGSYNVFEKNRRVTPASLKVAFCEPIDTASLPPESRKVILCNMIYSVIKEKLGV